MQFMLFAVKLCGIVPLRHFFTDKDEATLFKCFPPPPAQPTPYDKGTSDVKISVPLSHLLLVDYPCYRQLTKLGLKQ